MLLGNKSNAIANCLSKTELKRSSAIQLCLANASFGHCGRILEDALFRNEKLSTMTQRETDHLLQKKKKALYKLAAKLTKKFQKPRFISIKID